MIYHICQLQKLNNIYIDKDSRTDIQSNVIINPHYTVLKPFYSKHTKANDRIESYVY